MSGTLLHHLLDEAATRFAHTPAVTFAERTLTYEQLHEASHRAATWLRAKGLRRGDRIVVATGSDLFTVPLIYGSARAGTVFVLLHEQVRGAALGHVLDDAQPGLVISDNPAAIAEATQRGIAVVSTATAAETILDGDGGPYEGPAPLAVDPVCFIYTSGSTGLPKAVVSTHNQVVFAATAIQSRLGYRGDDTIFAAPPLSFDYGLYQLFLAVQGGSHVWLCTAHDVGPTIVRNLRRSQATILPALPSLAENLARMLARYGGSPALRLLTNTGAAMKDQTLAVLRQHIPALRVQLMFGLTECKRIAIMPPDEDLRRPGACGLPLPGTEIAIVDEHGQALPPGEIGELVVRGPHVMAGYWRRPDLTAQRFPRTDGLFPELRTGDYGWLDADGYLYFHGRRDDIYKSHGVRVSATEVEAAARRIDGIDSAALLPPTADREDAVLFVVSDLPPVEVLKHLRAQIEPLKVPTRCVTLTEMPLSSNGKIDRQSLAATLTSTASHA